MALGGQITGMIIQTIFWVFIIGLIAAVAAGGYFLGVAIFRLMRYKIKVLVLDHVGNSEIARNDLAKEFKDVNKTRKLKLLHSGDEIPLPNPDKYISMGVRKLLVLHKHGDMLTPMGLTHNSPANFTFNMDDLVSVLFWRETDHQEALETYRDHKKSFMEQYGAWVMSTMMIVIMFVLFFILINKLGSLQIRVDSSQLVKAAVPFALMWPKDFKKLVTGWVGKLQRQ